MSSKPKNDVQRALDLAARAGQLEASGCAEAVAIAGAVRVLLDTDAHNGPFLESTFENCEDLLRAADETAQDDDSTEMESSYAADMARTISESYS